MKRNLIDTKTMVNVNFIKLELWRIWIFIFITSLHIYLIYTTIHDYLILKALSIDLAYGGNWKPFPMNLQLSCLLCSITLLPIILLSSIIVTDNLANDGHLLGKDIDNNHFIFDSDSKGHLIRIDLQKPNSDKSVSCCGVQATLKQQFLPLSIFLQIISGFCYLLPLPFIEAQKIHYRALTPNHLWHTDLDFLIDSDKDHEDFTNQQKWNFQLPIRPAYFNMIFCLSQLTLRYPIVFWKTNRKFSLLFCVILILLSLHILVDFSSTSILIRLAVNPEYVSESMISSFSPFIICLISVLGSFILLFMQISVFNYGLNQYFNSLTIHRQNLRLQYKMEQNKKSSDHEESSNVSSETLDVNDNVSVELQDCDVQFSKYISHLVAIIFGFAGMSIKTPLFLQNSNIFSITGDRIMYLNLVLAILFSIMWLILWFGLSLHNTWQFKVASSLKENERINLNHGASIGGVTSTTNNYQLHQSSITEPSSPVYATCHPAGITLVRRNFTPIHMKSFDSCDETDLSSCQNYVLLHNVNSNKCDSPSNPSLVNLESILRQSFMNKNKRTASPFLNPESAQIINIDESFGSEQSFGSNLSRSLTNQDKTKYNFINQDPSDASLRNLVNRYYSSIDNPNTRKDQRLHIGRSPLLSYQFSTESSPSESQSRRSIVDHLTARVSFKDDIIEKLDPNISSHKQHLESKRDFSNIMHINKQFDIPDPNPTIEKMRTILMRAENQNIDSRKNVNEHFPEINSLLNQNGFNENTLVIKDKAIGKNSPLNLGILNENKDELSLQPSNYVNITTFDENNSEDERLCSQV